LGARTPPEIGNVQVQRRSGRGGIDERIDLHTLLVDGSILGHLGDGPVPVAECARAAMPWGACPTKNALRTRHHHDMHLLAAPEQCKGGTSLACDGSFR